jgi:serralysin
MREKGIVVRGYLPMDRFYLVAIGQNADRGHASITHQTGSGFWVTQGYDTMPGHPGGEFNVDFYVNGSGFKYLGGAPYGGTIKHVIVHIDDQLGYDISKLHIGISPHSYSDLFSGDPFAKLEKYLVHDDKFFGSPFDDTFNTGRGNDLAWGGPGTGKDNLKGGAGNDLMDGGDGNDILNGGGGHNTYQFSTPPSAANLDTIVKFKPGDEIYLMASVFPELGNKVDQGEFIEGSAAQDADDHLIWNKGTKVLYWDPDGNGAAPQVALAQFGNDASLSHRAFEIGAKYDYM